MLNKLLIILGKSIITLSKTLNLGNGSTWPGHIALSVNKNFIKDVLKTNNQKMKIIVVVGTNGKTTTANILQTILQESGKKVFRNTSGANLLNGIASTLVLHSNKDGTLNYDYGIFEIDENALPLVLRECTPNYIVVLNLFRDQLDRYGEVNTIASKWSKAFKKLTNSTTLVLNADDPQIAYLGKVTQAQTKYFGLSDKTIAITKYQHAVDSTYCPSCGEKLIYTTVYYSHLGEWKCTSCNYERPKLDQSTAPCYPLAGIYNRYNTDAATLVAKSEYTNDNLIEKSLEKVKPAFGRQEIVEVNSKRVQIFLSKNPTSFNQSLRTIKELCAKTLLIVLNDRIPDGRDVSWIWDVDFEDYLSGINVHVAGDRCWDIALRLKYAHPAINHVDTHEKLNYAIRDILKELPNKETLYILPTYSAMLEVRKIVTGKKIL